MPTFEEFAVEAREEYKDVFEAGLAIPDLANAIFSRRVAEPIQKVIRALAMIVVNDFGALLVLAMNGYGIAAAKIARTMFEASVNIAYLRLHPEEVDNFIDYHDLSVKQFYDHLLKFAPEEAKTLPPDKVEETLKRYEQIKDRFPNKLSWTPKGLPERSEEVKSLALYRLLYPTLSGFIHSDIRAIVIQNDAATMDIEVAPSKKWVREALVLGHNSLVRAVADYSEVAAADADKHVLLVHEGFKKAWGIASIAQSAIEAIQVPLGVPE